MAPSFGERNGPNPKAKLKPKLTGSKEFAHNFGQDSIISRQTRYQGPKRSTSNHRDSNVVAPTLGSFLALHKLIAREKRFLSMILMDQRIITEYPDTGIYLVGDLEASREHRLLLYLC